MDQKSVRIPQQKRSIEKKEKIVEAAERVFSSNGYFGTNTAEIAREAGLSTGSVYAYFEDKMDILLACLEKNGRKIIADVCREISSFSESDGILETTKKAIGVLVKFHHGQTRLYHDELKSLQYRDDHVRDYFRRIKTAMLEAVTGEIDVKGYEFSRGDEQMFLIIQMVEAIQDELTYDQSPDIHRDVLLDECARIIVSMLRKKADVISEIP